VKKHGIELLEFGLDNLPKRFCKVGFTTIRSHKDNSECLINGYMLYSVDLDEVLVSYTENKYIIYQSDEPNYSHTEYINPHFRHMDTTSVFSDRSLEKIINFFNLSNLDIIYVDNYPYLIVTSNILKPIGTVLSTLYRVLNKGEYELRSKVEDKFKTSITLNYSVEDKVAEKILNAIHDIKVRKLRSYLLSRDNSQYKLNHINNWAKRHSDTTSNFNYEKGFVDLIIKDDFGLIEEDTYLPEVYLHITKESTYYTFSKEKFKNKDFDIKL